MDTAERITENAIVKIDGIKYLANSLGGGDAWTFQLIGRRGKPVRQCRVGKVRDGAITYIGRTHHRF